MAIYQVGSVVRAPWPDHEKSMGKAFVAIVQDDETVVLLWEPLPPQPIPSQLQFPSSNRPFLVAPLIPTKEQEMETTAPVKDVKRLLPFEETGGDDKCKDVAVWKDRGDQLLRLGDASSAVSYYEIALRNSSLLQIGGTIIIKVGGHLKLAEVDCIDDDSVDVTIVETDDETTIPIALIMLCVQDPDPDHLQERILLNLARCLLLLVDVDVPNRPLYFKAAVRATTLTFTMASFHNRSDENNTLTANAQMALVLRVRAQAGLSKWAHARQDAKRLIKVGHKDGQKLLADLERQQKNQVKTDKKLAKAVSQWVHTATSQSVSDDQQQDNPQLEETEQDSSPRTPKPSTTNNPISSWLFLLLPLIGAFLIHFVFQR
jgi:hypothetical protein